MLKTITAAEAARLLQAPGALLIDIREADEHARERIPAVRNLPLSRLSRLGQGSLLGRDAALPTGTGALVFHCRSGARTASQAARLAAWAGTAEAFILDGGLDAWKRAGLPIARDRRQPIELMRQVQIAAGSLVLAGVVLGALASPWFVALSGFVGAGLVFAGISGTCGLAHLLRRMPWNSRAPG